jgi:hypothetical protein
MWDQIFPLRVLLKKNMKVIKLAEKRFFCYISFGDLPLKVSWKGNWKWRRKRDTIFVHQNNNGGFSC